MKGTAAGIEEIDFAGACLCLNAVWILGFWSMMVSLRLRLRLAMHANRGERSGGKTDGLFVQR
jgi:hypothetical protein